MQLHTKLVIYVPLTHADELRKALGDIGVGKIGDYDYCSFSSKGIGRFRGNKNSNPTIGEPEHFESVEEERIEFLLPKSLLKDAIKKMKEIHPYEEPAFDVYTLEDYD